MKSELRRGWGGSRKTIDEDEFCCRNTLSSRTSLSEESGCESHTTESK